MNNLMDECSYSISLRHESSTGTSVQELLVSILTTVESLTLNHIWHKQSFNLTLPIAPKTTTVAGGGNATVINDITLTGKTNCTDCVDDEWLIVWCLFKLSLLHPDAVIAINDEDGEFLLIEGAEVLPKWVTPNNAINRVWIYQGRLHLIPIHHVSTLPFSATPTPTLQETSEEEEGFLDRLAAIALVRDDTIDTLAPSDLEAIVLERISGYPGKIQEHQHTSLAYLPVDIALALAEDPRLIAEAIAAFYEREPSSLKACNKMTRFPPTAPSLAFSSPTASESESATPATVFVPTLLTRPLYSQLVLQRFFPPKVFERVGWMDGAKVGSEEERRRSVGMKIACGFEMLHSTTAPILRTSTEFNPLEPRYRAFLAQLSTRGYFEGEIEGSSKYTELEARVRSGWIASYSDPTKRPSFAQRVDEAVTRARTRLPMSLAHRITHPLSPDEAIALESSEEWLSLDEQGLEEMLRQRGPKGEEQGPDEDLEGFGPGEGYSDEEGDDDDEEGGDRMEGVEMPEQARKRAEDKMAKKAAKRLERMASKVEAFVEGRGALDGAQFEDELSDDDESDEEEADLTPLSAEERATRLATLVAPLDLSTWGSDNATPAVSASAPPPLVDDTIDSIPLRPRSPKLTSEKYDGASSDSGSSVGDDEEMKERDDMAENADEDDEDGPTIVEEEVDMGGEMDEFLKFATETLGLTQEQYSKILGERRSRGAFVPPTPAPKKASSIPSTSSSKSAPAAVPTPKPTLPKPILKNPNLTSFDALMERMDSELIKSRAPTSSSIPGPPPASSSKPAATTTKSTKSKPNPRAPTSTQTPQDPDSSGDEIDSDDIEGMDEELAELFKTVSGEDARNGEGTMDYNVVKNFLESFQSQGGFGGPAGNLAGRLGFPLPKNFDQE